MPSELKRDGTTVWWDHSNNTETYCPMCNRRTGEEQDISDCCGIPVERMYSSDPDDD